MYDYYGLLRNETSDYSTDISSSPFYWIQTRALCRIRSKSLSARQMILVAHLLKKDGSPASFPISTSSRLMHPIRLCVLHYFVHQSFSTSFKVRITQRTSNYGVSTRYQDRLTMFKWCIPPFYCISYWFSCHIACAHLCFTFYESADFISTFITHFRVHESYQTCLKISCF